MNCTVKGSFHLRSATRLIPWGRGGVVLRSKPLRALKVNASAFSLLRRCEKGLSLESAFLDTSTQADSTLNLLDRLCRTGLLEWRPSEEPFEQFVSIVIAVYNRAGEIGACLESLLALDYPAAKREIVVVDDGSDDDTATVVSRFDVKLIRHGHNRGQSAARNTGAAQATGEIVAFIDSDCIAEPGWLRELVPYFQDSRNVLVGGYVASFFQETLLDRYEAAKSPLNMGEHEVIGSGRESDFYVPTCNMLVKRDVYLRAGGLDKDLRVGEDVDFCWRLKEEGFRLVYAPKGRVRHKHRNRFHETFKRRFDYGTSEPVLYARHEAIVKRYPWQPACIGVFLLCALGLLLRQPLFAAAGALVFLWDVISGKRLYEKQIGISLRFGTILTATAARHFGFQYYLCFYLTRYYLIPMVLLCLLFPPILPLIAALVLVPSISEYFTKKADLNFPAFVVLFLAEQASYQTGVFCGCLKERSFRTYRLAFTTTGSSARTSILGRLKAISGSARKSGAIQG